MIMLIHCVRSFAQKKVIFRLQLTENSSIGFLLYAKSNVTVSLNNVVNVSLHGATVYRSISTCREYSESLQCKVN